MNLITRWDEGTEVCVFIVLAGITASFYQKILNYFVQLDCLYIEIIQLFQGRLKKRKTFVEEILLKGQIN